MKPPTAMIVAAANAALAVRAAKAAPVHRVVPVVRARKVVVPVDNALVVRDRVVPVVIVVVATVVDLAVRARMTVARAAKSVRRRSRCRR